MKIGYSRISTADQSIDLQTDALNAAGAERIFSDTATGRNTDRPEFRRMLDTIRSGDVVIVWRLDRLARSLKDLLDTSAVFEACGVQLVSVTEGIDTTTPAGKLFFQIFGALAEFERNLIVERTNAGLSAARARGRKGGRRSVLDKGKQKAISSMLAAARESGTDPNWREIAAAVGVSDRTVRRFAVTIK